ncbi:hypothetical protein BH20CHL4_BH20CHL4_02110 [soil metagenome]
MPQYGYCGGLLVVRVDSRDEAVRAYNAGA